MYATHNMHFGYRLAVITFYKFQHFINAQFPAFFPVGIQAAVGTKFATEHTYVGRFNMKIAVEIGFIAMQMFPHKIGQ